MMRPRVLETEEDYQAALAYVETLMDATPGSPEEEELELWALLIETYEEAHLPIDPPDPVEAIKFRMDQAGLTRKDLAPYLGSQSKVSEVLNRKRPLSLTMIRTLHEGLSIPAEVLLGEPGRKLAEPGYRARDYPFREMFKRGYLAPFHGSLQEAKLRAETLLSSFFSVWGGMKPQISFCWRADRDVDMNTLFAWQTQVLQLARREHLPAYGLTAIDQAWIQDMVRQSSFQSGPQNARELLNKRGIHLIVLRHLPGTYLDGASFLSPQGRPIIGLTLRHDRLDNFWFTLLHELGHVRLHLKARDQAFFDDTERPFSTAGRPEEDEANAFAQDILIPARAWEGHADDLLSPICEEAIVIDFARALEISPAIVAGRIRWETGDYKRFGALVGYRQVRPQFDLA